VAVTFNIQFTGPPDFTLASTPPLARFRTHTSSAKFRHFNYMAVAYVWAAYSGTVPLIDTKTAVGLNWRAVRRVPSDVMDEKGSPHGSAPAANLGLTGADQAALAASCSACSASLLVYSSAL